MAPLLEDGSPNTEMLPYACGGVFCAGIVYLILSALIKGFGAKKVMRFFPPVVTGPIIIAIGLILAPTAINNCATNWPVAIIALVTVVIFNIWGRGMSKIVPILIGIIVSYIAAFVMGDVSFEGIGDEASLGLPPITLMKFDISAIITIMPLALATMMEHIGDISAIGATTGKNYIEKPGLHRTLLGDGLATCLAAAFGAPANTTYGENTGVLALTKVYDPKVMLIAAVMTIILSFVSIFDAFINTIPWSIIGGISMVLYGMISATGVRTIVENKVDFTNMRNILIAALILVCGLGFNAYPLVIGRLSFGGLAVAAVVGIVVNAILPGKDYTFDENIQG